MAKRYVVIENNIVQNIALFEDEASALSYFGTDRYVLVEEDLEVTGVADVGGTWDGSKFTPAPLIEPPTPIDLSIDE